MNYFTAIGMIVLTAATVRADTGCTLTGNSLDSLSKIVSSCTDIIIEDFVIPAGKTLDLTGLLDGTTVTFKGTVTLEYQEWTGNVIAISGKNVRIVGDKDSVIDGRGSLWWDGLGGNGGKSKPRLFSVSKMYDSVIENLYIANSPRHCFFISRSENLTITGVTINDSDGDANGGHNTDGFGVQNSDYVYIQNSFVYNQDDCIAVSSGTNYFFKNNYCSGGHGISIGSVKTGSIINNIHVHNSTIVNSENGIRIKTVYGAVNAQVNNVMYEDITLVNITDYGIVIRGDYENLGPTGTPTDGVPITNLTIINVHGTVQPSGTNIYVLLADGVASNWEFSDIDISGGTHIVTCTGVPERSGITC